MTFELKRVIDKIEDLASPSVIYNKISKMLEDDRVAAYDLGRVISTDTSLTAKLLRLVNSPFYGFPHKITNINYAVAILGFNAIKNLVMGTSVFELFKAPPYLRNFMENLWRHSIGCAVGAKVIAKYIKYAEPEELFVGGLLHDIGKAVEMQFFSNNFINVLELFYKEGVDFNQAEQNVMGFTHTTVGKLLCEKWKFSRKLVEIVTHHHTLGFNLEFAKEVAVVHLADIISRALGMGADENEKVPPPNEGVWNILGLQVGVIEPIMYEIKRIYKEIVEFLLGYKQ